MHSVEYNNAPSSFVDIWTKNYALPNPRTELFKKSPLYTLLLEWNNLDATKYIRNRVTFKTALKYNLLNAFIDSTHDN